MVWKRQGPGRFTSIGHTRTEMTWWEVLENSNADGLHCLWKQINGSLSLQACWELKQCNYTALHRAGLS